MASSAKTTLVAATATRIASAGVGGTRVLVKTALTDVYIGSANVTSDGAASYGALAAGVNGPYDIEGDLYAISAGGGVIYALLSNT